MRELKFRAMIVGKDGPWIATQGNHHEIDTPAKFLAHYGEDELMQFTGLKDKNGVEIYEGDIIDLPGYDERLIVEWGFTSADGEAVGYQTIDTDEAEVIGNIYENPDLLK